MLISYKKAINKFTYVLCIRFPLLLVNAFVQNEEKLDTFSMTDTYHINFLKGRVTLETY